MKPQRYVNDKIISTIEEDTTGADIFKVAESLVSNATMLNIKAHARAEMDSSGHNFDAVGKYKEKVCEKLSDPFLIYKVHNKSLDNSRPSFVFKSSKQQLQIAIDMDREGDNPLSQEYCHLDGNHKRCASFKTITLWVYHPFLRQMCKIATMEAESENSLSMNIFWEVLNEAIQEYSNDANRKFKPFGCMMDEAGAFWSSISCVQGVEDIQRSVSCEKHFDFTVARQKKTLVGEDTKKEFEFLCESVSKAETPLVYERAAERMVQFIATHTHLHSWWDWWHKRQGHVFRAFKPLHNVPKTNHAEIGHSRWVKIGAVNLSLIDACREDVAESVKLSASLDAYGAGALKGGTGPSSADLRKRRYAEQSNRADAYIAELDEVALGDVVMTNRETCGFVEPTSSHRHDPVEKSQHSKNDRATPYRPKRSKPFLRSLDIAKKTKRSFIVQDKIITKKEARVHLKHVTGKVYDVTISTFPHCAECAYCTRQNLCSHVLWVYLFVFNLPESSDLLQQRALTCDELAGIISSLRISPNVSGNKMLQPGHSNSNDASTSSTSNAGCSIGNASTSSTSITGCSIGNAPTSSTLNAGRSIGNASTSSTSNVGCSIGNASTSST